VAVVLRLDHSSPAITPFGKDVLHGDEGLETRLLVVFSGSASALGALCCERLSGRKGRDRPRAVRIDRDDGLRRRPLASDPGHGHRELARDGETCSRSPSSRGLYSVPPLCPDPEPLAGEPPRADHRREQTSSTRSS
jgi:hypothetical protein